MRLFPILLCPDEIPAVRRDGGMSVLIAMPWDLVKQHEKQCLENHSQTVDTLARRGGLGASELVAVLENRRWKPMKDIEAHQRLRELHEDYIRAQIEAQLAAISAEQQS